MAKIWIWVVIGFGLAVVVGVWVYVHPLVALGVGLALSTIFLGVLREWEAQERHRQAAKPQPKIEGPFRLTKAPPEDS